MKALIRGIGAEQFVYKDIVYENGRFKTADGCHELSEFNIIHIVKDVRKNKVRCGGCGALIKNTPEAIESHFREMEKDKNCLTCSSVIEGYNTTDKKVKYKPHPTLPGKYIVNQKYTADLMCNVSGRYSRQPIGSPDAERMCKYLKCRTAGVREITGDFFIDYPGAFTVFPTVDKLIEKGWVFESISRNMAVYHHKRMTTLKAIVNSKGIIHNFRAFYKRNDCIDMVYSDKYDKVFYIRNGNRYCTTYCDIDDSKADSYAKRIKELY